MSLPPTSRISLRPRRPKSLVNLPVAVYSRSTGSTSPIDTLTTEAGVQTDDSGDLEVMGAPPPLLSITVDGISSVGVEYSGPVNEMFPSFNSIEEIRVSESNNNAEFSGVADITTISKSGTNQWHGGVLEKHENTVINSGVPVAYATSKPKINMNDFGGTVGGPLVVPQLYNGHDKTFFFASYEGLRLLRVRRRSSPVFPHWPCVREMYLPTSCRPIAAAILSRLPATDLPIRIPSMRRMERCSIRAILPSILPRPICSST